MPRDMSYRKPVPVYIPSPPLSPLTKQESSSERHCSRGAPPLPREWREIIERALTSSDSTAPTLRLSSNSSSGCPDVQLKRRNSTNTSIVFKNPALIRRESAWSAAHFSQEEKCERQLHHIYRPPTPPIRTHRPKRRKIEIEPEEWDSCSTLPIGSAAMRLQNSRSTGRTLVAIPPEESPPLGLAGGKEGWEVMAGGGWTDTLKKWLRMAHPTSPHIPDGQDQQPANSRTHYHIPSPFEPQYQHPSNLSDLQETEGGERRAARPHEPWRPPPSFVRNGKRLAHISDELSPKKRHSAELLSLPSVAAVGNLRLVGQEEFRRYVEAKEVGEYSDI
ncbi:hypothetical protein AX15_007687 [Amanita polypyramis BW_CC]|nr:hypothetical protein AX15_007687 [Amanita polypyramis BW_CC]